MPKQKNIDSVAGIKDKLSKAKSVTLTDYRGLTHKQSEDLHRQIKKSGGEYLVVKNSLLKIASGNIETTGPTAVLFSYEDEILPLKELAKFQKTYSLPKIKFSLISGTRYDEAETESLSKLPGKQDLQTILLSRLSSPLYGLLYTLNGNLQKLVYVLGVIRDGKTN